MISVDLNSDVGESYGMYNLGMDREVLGYVSSVNIACGWHAGDPMVMEKTVKEAVKHGVKIGAHPGLPDLLGFGRRMMEIESDEAKNYVMYQIGALTAFTESAGVPLQHVKPHGALYNMAAKDRKLALAVAKAVKSVDRDLILVGLAGSYLVEAGEELGLNVAQEVFADRAYHKEGNLVPRKEAGSMIEDEEQAVGRVIRMIKEKKVYALTGEDIAIQADSICVHGDNPRALAFVKKIRQRLQKENIRIASMEEKF